MAFLDPHSYFARWAHFQDRFFRSWPHHPQPISLLTITPDRLYLAAYLQPPTAETLFPYPETSTTSRRRAQRAGEANPASPVKRFAPCYFSVDDILLYNAFHHDFGPLHIGHLYRFAIQFHDILGAKENKDRPIVFWSAADPRSTLNDPRTSLMQRTD